MTGSLRVIVVLLATSFSAAAGAAAQTRSAFEWQKPEGSVERGSLGAAAQHTYKIHGAIAGALVGAGVTAIVVHSGGSTSLCDRSANQDAINSTECAGLIAAGGLVGGLAGYFIGGRIHRDVRVDVVPRVSPGGSYFLVGVRRNVFPLRIPR
jgi:hypothetical protein